jgi:hypothetical protein
MSKNTPTHPGQFNPHQAKPCRCGRQIDDGFGDCVSCGRQIVPESKRKGDTPWERLFGKATK